MGCPMHIFLCGVWEETLVLNGLLMGFLIPESCNTGIHGNSCILLRKRHMIHWDSSISSSSGHAGALPWDAAPQL